MRFLQACMLTAVAAAAMTSCRHKDVYDEYIRTAPVEVVFDWSDAPDASPTSMSLYLFPEDGGQALRYEFTDIAGGTVTVPLGTYDALCLNSDTEKILLRGTDRITTFEAYTGASGLLAALSSTGVYPSSGRSSGDTPPAAADEPAVAEPDPLWSGSSFGVTVTEPAGDAVQTITMRPAAALRKYSVEISGAENLDCVTAISASLSGMGASLLLHSAEPSADAATVPFGLTVGDDITSLSGSMQAFGPAESAAAHKLVVYAVMDNGEKWYYTYDVTRQVTEAPDPRNVTIRLEGLPLPAPMVGGDGFVPDVDGWKDISIDITMKPSQRGV